ncbi:hypothetical protein N0002_12910 [Pseudomonas aeruginosa]|uniref:Uncharacterized protein n=1 Tax=Pseudomonas aeruginosa TaxID=287 RepID=A0A7M2ZY11_PSEAI|nr:MULTISPECIES: hypothetical protein [Pseudomonas]ALZ17118.1 hypothetical protein HV97_00315 [Pseudomonas aeruginosa]EWH25681.1 hypothetical protein Z695_0132120 [Pseudomonas aeruginosa SG17M]KSG02887.1 hypothetical protein AO951_20905 [Pseudomonas aeruginosa]KSH31972.1 hypothetical protein AO967_26500 [Pseudomonas aeruginosa]KSK21949.1 hypothetical protein APA38_26680 [Pseudomonas aeruginosa]
MSNAKVSRMMDRIALGGLAGAYAQCFEHYSDHRQAMQMTCKAAIRAGYRPAACWVSAVMLAAGKPTHTVAFTKGSSPSFLVVQVGGVGIDHELDVMFDPKNGDPGWKLIEGEAGDQYQAWAQNREPDGIEYEIACQ